MTHDPRRIPMDPTPESAGFLESIRAWLNIGKSRRNKRESAQQEAAEANRAHRAAEARRRDSQPGAKS